jgi:hypothetical protein
MRRRSAPASSPWSAVGATVLYPLTLAQADADAEASS